MSTPTDNLSPVIDQLNAQIEQMLLLLNQKEKHVIEERFDLNNKGRKTLEDIGGFYNVTRERIRQIEKTALNKLKRNIENFVASKLNDEAFNILNENGGIIRAENLISLLLNGSNEQTRSSILLVLSLDRRFDYLSNTIHYHPYFRLSHINDELVSRISSGATKKLRDAGNLCEAKEVLEAIKSEAAGNITIKTVLSALSVNKSFKIMGEKVGLMEWRQINPRTLRDKIYFILRKSNKPIHFIDISNAIIQENFDRKNVNMQAVHNELIRHEDFVLIGRGIYALKEWGYDHGTVADIIQQVLKGKESLSEQEIIDEVLKRRKVKPITIILNLKNKKQFVRVGRKQYALKAQG